MYIQTAQQLQLMQNDRTSVIWGEGEWRNYGKRKDHSRVVSITKSDGSVATVHEFDKLLLNNGKFKFLKGKVVSYDYGDIFYQNTQQRAKMELDSAKRSTNQAVSQSSEKWQRAKEKDAKKLRIKEERQQIKLDGLRKDFEADVKYKLETLSPADFEKWKNKELVAIKKIELQRELASKLKEKSAELEAEKLEAFYRSRFTKSFSRNQVFSILRADGPEEIIYNADTLGYFADGEAEVEYGVEEMRMYIKGRQDGRKHSFHDVYIGAGVGLASALLLTYTWDAFYAPIPPAICIAVMAGLRKVKPSAKLELTQNFLTSEAYMDGYHRSAKGRKIFAFTMGAVGGLGVGITVGMITNPLLQKSTQ